MHLFPRQHFKSIRNCGGFPDICIKTSQNTSSQLSPRTIRRVYTIRHNKVSYVHSTCQLTQATALLNTVSATGCSPGQKLRRFAAVWPTNAIYIWVFSRLQLKETANTTLRLYAHIHIVILCHVTFSSLFIKLLHSFANIIHNKLSVIGIMCDTGVNKIAEVSQTGNRTRAAQLPPTNVSNLSIIGSQAHVNPPSLSIQTESSCSSPCSS